MTQLSDLAQLLDFQSRSITAENPTGAKGGGARAEQGTGAEAARDLGVGWKVSPSVHIGPGATVTLASIDGPGAIRHIWLTSASRLWRSLILRCYWDGDEDCAVEVPIGDFFCNGWGVFSQVSSIPIASNPHGGFNSYWIMPFSKKAVITVENTSDEIATLYYQIDYSLGPNEGTLGYFHAQWRRSNPVPYGSTHLLLALPEGTGRGHYVGTYIAWGVNNSGWWGEGELKVYLDGDDGFPTICGTGTEDYFGGAWNFDVPGQGYTTFTTPFLGLSQVIRPDGLYASQQRFGMYRWHIPDPIAFHDSIKVDIQALGWRSGRRYLPLQDDISSTCVFYLEKSSCARPDLPGRDELEVI